MKQPCVVYFPFLSAPTSAVGVGKTLPSPPYALYCCGVETGVLEIMGASTADVVAIVLGVKKLTGGVLELDQVENCGTEVTGFKKTGNCDSSGNPAVTTEGSVGRCELCSGG